MRCSDGPALRLPSRELDGDSTKNVCARSIVLHRKYDPETADPASRRWIIRIRPILVHPGQGPEILPLRGRLKGTSHGVVVSVPSLPYVVPLLLVVVVP